MIIQIRGTSGSGKTTAMRTVMDLLSRQTYVQIGRIEGRRNPLYYHWISAKLSVSVLGSYESTCGGVDTIHGYDQLQSLVRERSDCGHVLMEGILLSEDVKQTLAMNERLCTADEPLRVIFLNTPLDVCLERVRKRRAEAGNDKPLNETNTRNRVDTIQRARARLETAGVLCRSAACSQVPRLVLSWLKGA